ncbi:hypothetical protein [Lysobacter antibioticus]|uniref:Transmembrane protein n=1 Tax=Lysobacter antibioticus TaxID=84531 RepID=A0A0S2FBD9_LYSAN|nr:hypothetical protein [Lysobacter antibioticus]ALN80846.1 hypothetical protein LA76x_2716 [Lysobacter antibioticus]
MNAHPLRWQAPQPLWSRFGDAAGAAATAEQARPAILRFASDDFMEQLLGTLARDPTRIDKLVARYETWRKPMVDPPDLIERAPMPQLVQASGRIAAAKRPKPRVAAADADAPPLKLYQPAHQRHYVATASLVCGIQGLPEHALVRGGGEEVSMVLRRLMPVPGDASGTLHEFAYLKDLQGARWQRCNDNNDFVPGEDRLPAFALSFLDDGQHRRALWAGSVPVGRREEYLGCRVDTAPSPTYATAQREQLSPSVPAPANSKLARTSQFQIDVSEPWKTMIRSAFKLATAPASTPTIGDEAEPPGDRVTRAFNFNLQQQSASWLVLLDCADHLQTYLPDVWNAIDNNGAGYAALSSNRRALYDWLGTVVMSAPLIAALQPTVQYPVAASMRAALKAIRAPGVREKLEASTATFAATPDTRGLPDWPRFSFCLAGVEQSLAATGPYTALDSLGDDASIDPDPVAGNVPGQDVARKVDRFTALYARALEATTETDAPPVPFALQVKNALGNNLGANLGDGGWFVLRFVHGRRDCGPLHPPLLSAPSERFRLASFFDSDAPARPIRISLPADTSPAGLRKYQKNTAFVLSDMLCGQVQRAKGMGLVDLVLSVLPWPFHKDLPAGDGAPCQSGGINIGMICSLSIPIITICALILLIIIVILFDLIFRWLPYFVICFPVPGLKGKKDSS